MAKPKASQIRMDTAKFNNNLSPSDDDAQKALETLDETAGGSGMGSSRLKYIIAEAQVEGDLHLLDAVNWVVDKAIIKTIRIATLSTDWDLYILQNDNGYAADDANIPMRQIMGNGNGDLCISLDAVYEDEDASSEVHLYYRDNSGAATVDIYIQGIELI